ncbi:class I SAM-dependent methyltransferase [Arenimonas sp.]|uniref:class I SAM-dependent methyltransferase n=1 Tax=Arenimonas sp. TaxID=1872635 RepID=UPI0035B4E0B8
MSLPDESARRAAWSAYWATGGLHSCVGSFGGNYGGAIGGFWRNVFSRLPATPVRALDLATGNGAIPLMLWEQRGQGGLLTVDAVDLAQLAPTWHRPDQHAGIRFHAGVAMEALPFDDASFDLVTSQYGFEYARRDEALAEALRVLKPGGTLALVMHHAGSVLVQVGRAELAHQDHLLAAHGLLDCAAAVIPWFAQARRGVDPGQFPEARAARAGYNAAIERLLARIAAAPAPDLLVETRDWTNQLLASVGTDPALALDALGRYRDGMLAAGLRTAELVSHALDEVQAQALVATIRNARPGADVRCEPLSQAEGLLGWGLELRAG